MSEQLRTVWLVDGDDPTLVAEAVRGLVDDLVGDADRSMALEDHRGEEVDLAAVADACRTPPFLSDRRVVVVRDVGRWGTEELSPILDYLEDPFESTALILAAGGGRLAPKLLAAVKAKGHITGTAVSGREAKGWVRDRIKASKVRLDGGAEALVEAHLGEDVSRLGSLLEVLAAAYGEGARLGAADIEPYLGEAGSVAPWDFTDAIDSGRTEAALELLHRLMEAGERHPLVILSILTRHVQGMLRVDGDDIVTEAQAAAAMGLAKGRSTYPAKKALASARRMGPSGVAEAVGLVADAEVALKGGTEWPAELVLEVLVARLCRLARAGAGARR
ncbi:DNA polymerase III subunit delta [Acidiferrimicrobium sp. IK]|uniref:DNA polymerase III subunit delta n=1 Tax=Acidiferrimicrobium sp. IK TaxID=2871700 RepID=UPI0021CB998D|nr:DNA polymerase III subunit delta [Acidiferrimicrobium sp. IK]MCU4187328.1 DNA polymerase III subunit delta [Acidiferrimicrobium sp. IK]